MVERGPEADFTEAPAADTPASDGPSQDAAEVPPPVADALAHVMERVLYRARRGVRRAIGAGRERLERRQAERDLEHFWMRLGKTAYRLVEAGEIEHPALRKAMERIDVLEQRIAEEARRSEAAAEEEHTPDLAGPDPSH